MLFIAVRPRCTILDLPLLYVMLAIGLNLVVGFAGLLDLATSPSTRWGLYLRLPGLAPTRYCLPFWLVLRIGGRVCGAGGGSSSACPPCGCAVITINPS